MNAKKAILFVNVLLGISLLNGMENLSKGSKELLEYEKGFDNLIDISDPVMTAVRRGDFESLRQLVENGKADLKKVTVGKITPLAYIAGVYSSKNLELALRFINYLIDHNANVNQPSGIRNKLPIEYALEVGHSELARYLIQCGADINENILSITDSASCTLLHYAIENVWDSEFIKLLLQHGASVTKLYPEGDSMLHKELSLNPRSEVCKLLLEYGANPNQPDEEGRTALHMLSYYHEKYVFENINLKEIDFGLMKTIVDMLLGKGALIEAKNNKEETPLMSAVRRGRLDVACALISNGAQRTWNCDRWNTIKDIIDKNLQETRQENTSNFGYNLWNSIRIIVRPVDLQADEASYTLLHYAIENVWDSEFIKLLLQHGADITKLYPEGDSMLHRELSMNPRSEVCRLLLEYGANPNQLDKKGRTALHMLSSQHERNAFENIYEPKEIDLGSMKTIVDMLLDKGALIEARNNKEETPLMSAVRKGRLDIVFALINNGAQRTWNCNRGNTIKRIVDEKLQEICQENTPRRLFRYSLWKSIRIIIRSVDLQKVMQWHREHCNGFALAEAFKDSAVKNHVERFRIREIKGNHLKKHMRIRDLPQEENSDENERPKKRRRIIDEES